MTDLNSSINNVGRDPTAIAVGVVVVLVVKRQIPLIDAIQTPCNAFLICVHHGVLLDVLDLRHLRQGHGVGLGEFGGKSLEGLAVGLALLLALLYPNERVGQRIDVLLPDRIFKDDDVLIWDTILGGLAEFGLVALGLFAVAPAVALADVGLLALAVAPGVGVGVALGVLEDFSCAILFPAAFLVPP